MFSYSSICLPIYLPIAAIWAALGICYNTGQDCTAGSRVYVQDSIYDKFLKLLVEKVKTHVIGDGLDETTSGGPVVRWFIPSAEHLTDYIHLTGIEDAIRPYLGIHPFW